MLGKAFRTREDRIQRNRRRHFPYHADISKSPSIKLRYPLYDPLRSISSARCFRLHLFVILREPPSADPLRNWDFLRQIHIDPCLGSSFGSRRTTLIRSSDDTGIWLRMISRGSGEVRVFLTLIRSACVMVSVRVFSSPPCDLTILDRGW